MKYLIIALLLTGCASYQVSECPIGTATINVVEPSEIARMQMEYCKSDGRFCKGRVKGFYNVPTKTAYCIDVDTCIHEFLHYCNWDHNPFEGSRLKINKEYDTAKSDSPVNYSDSDISYNQQLTVKQFLEYPGPGKDIRGNDDNMTFTDLYRWKETEPECREMEKFEDSLNIGRRSGPTCDERQWPDVVGP